MATASGIRKKYAICLDEAVKWLNRNSYGVYPKSLNIKTEKDIRDKGNIVIRMSQPIHLKDWPERQGSRDKLDIVVEIEETVRAED